MGLFGSIKTGIRNILKLDEKKFLREKAKLESIAQAVDESLNVLEQNSLEEVPAYQKALGLRPLTSFELEVIQAESSRDLRDILARIDVVRAEPTLAVEEATKWLIEFKDKYNQYFNHMFPVRKGWVEKVLQYQKEHDVSYNVAKYSVELTYEEEQYSEAMRAYRKYQETDSPLLTKYESSNLINAVISWVVDRGGSGESFFETISDAEDYQNDSRKEQANEKIFITSNHSTSFF